MGMVAMSTCAHACMHVCPIRRFKVRETNQWVKACRMRGHARENSHISAESVFVTMTAAFVVHGWVVYACQ